MRITRLIGVYSDPADRIVTFPERVVHLIDIILEAEVVSGELRLSAESQQLRFFAPTELPEDDRIAPPTRRLIRDYLAGQGGLVA